MTAHDVQPQLIQGAEISSLLSDSYLFELRQRASKKMSSLSSEVEPEGHVDWAEVHRASHSSM